MGYPFDAFCTCDTFHHSKSGSDRLEQTTFAMLLLSILLLPLALALSPPLQSFINTAIARTIELGGATTQVTTQYNIKATTDSPGDYFLALAGERDEEPAWWEVMIGGKAVEGVTTVSSR